MRAGRTVPLGSHSACGGVGRLRCALALIAILSLITSLSLITPLSLIALLSVTIGLVLAIMVLVLLARGLLRGTRLRSLGRVLVRRGSEPHAFCGAITNGLVLTRLGRR